MNDPPVPADGTCAVCGRPRKRPETAVAKALLRGMRDPWAGDPFCSNVCARTFHGVKLSAEESRQASGVGARPPYVPKAAR